MVTYRSVVPITTQARKRAAYERAQDMFGHAERLGVDVLRVQYMTATQRIEVDLTEAISTEQLAHLGLEAIP